MHKNSFSRGNPHERSRNNYGNQRPEGRPHRPPGLTEKPALASALRLKNFKQLSEIAGEENLALALDLPLQRVRELLQGVNFSDETTFHLETTLVLPSGYFDQVNPQLSENHVKRLKSPLEQASVPEVNNEAQTEQEKLVRRSEKSAATQAQQPDAVMAGGTAEAVLEDVSPAAKAPTNGASKSAPTAASTKSVTPVQAAAPAQAAAPVQAQAPAPAAAPVIPTTPGPVDANELKLREVRRANLGVITQQPGSKSHLARLVDMSPANISHRLHGNKHFDEGTASFFCQKLNLPEGWFNEPHTEDDVPAHVLQMLGGSPRSNVASNRGGRPSKKRTLTRAPARTPAVLNMPATGDAGPALRSAVLSQPQAADEAGANTPDVAEGQAASTPAPLPGTASSVRLARGSSARQAAPSSLPLAAPGVRSAATPAASPVSSALEGGDGALGPVAEALIKTLALKARQGLLSETHALRMLTETMAL